MVKIALVCKLTLAVTFTVTFIGNSALAQIADTSFFASVRSINPGAAHKRSQALVSLDVGKKDIVKNQEVTAGGIIGGIETNVALQKNTLFAATKGSTFTFELLGDRETGTKTEHINSTTYGERDIENKATSTYFGGIIDMRLFGVSYSTANYFTANKFRVGTPPNVSANDLQTDINYSLLKVGTAFDLGNFTFGVFGMSQSSKGNYTYTYYDPSTGNPGTTEVWPAKTKAQGFGFGIGYTSKKFRFELSSESMSAAELEADDNPLGLINAPTASSRLSGTVEARFGKLALGGRVRAITGNFTDLEDLIPSQLLYGEMTETDKRLETSFNFSYGSDKGFTFSASYSQSTTNTDEENAIFGGSDTYPATTKSTAMGVNVSYYF